jgi:hypothetical protein
MAVLVQRIFGMSQWFSFLVFPEVFASHCSPGTHFSLYTMYVFVTSAAIYDASDERNNTII